MVNRLFAHFANWLDDVLPLLEYPQDFTSYLSEIYVRGEPIAVTRLIITVFDSTSVLYATIIAFFGVLKIARFHHSRSQSTEWR